MKQIQLFLGLATGICDLLDDVGDRGVSVFDDEDFGGVTFLTNQLVQEAVAFVADAILTPGGCRENSLDRRTTRNHQRAHDQHSTSASPSFHECLSLPWGLVSAGFLRCDRRSKPPQQNQYEQNHGYQSKPAARVVSPVSAVGPGG